MSRFRVKWTTEKGTIYVWGGESCVYQSHRAYEMTDDTCTGHVEDFEEWTKTTERRK